MSPTDEATPAPTRRDPDDILLKLERLIDDRQPPPQKSRTWIAALVIFVLAVAGIAVYAWINRRQVKELARLRHEQNKQRILTKKAAADTEAIQLEEQAAEQQRRFEKAAEDLRRLEADYRSEVARYEANLAAIDRIRSWRDVPGGNPG